MPASSEFVALCQSQIALLTQGLGACFSVIYLTEEFKESPNPTLVPIAAYPESIEEWEEDRILALLYTGMRQGSMGLRLLGADSAQEAKEDLPARLSASKAQSALPPPVETALLRQQQIVLPLIHEGVVMGLLVTARSDRAWNELEQAQIERIARTLAIACVLDQRGQWLAQDLQHQRMLQAQQHDILDDLLHQFRNPLTAIRTFGKLLLRRIRPDEANRNSVEGIVRESDRLQELLQEFDVAIDLGEADLLPYESDTAEMVDWDATASRESTAATVANSPPLLPGARFLLGARLQLEPHNIIDVLQPLLDSAAAIAQERQLVLQTLLPSALPPVCIDLKATREVLSNLIDNALKYTPAHGQVYVVVVPAPATVPELRQAIVVADTGPGIPLQDLAHLFERHYRGVQAATDIPGSGLGLAIARELVTQMDGDIQIFSPAQDSYLIQDLYQNSDPQTHPGTAVVVWLPQAT
ncbi:GAF domain-containing sensor histidine kinase [Oculatella sp. LEGE 06141]|uniref:GAF domain-containing sensor histidine kinase n=1 Tax=Oculatella sp. LEGE 06141 TaxID=1828648 RepID=UPI001D135F86|nr:GAF domain-containing sensor histidine kinase [Oculatella sp. LEGE 06141]